VRGGEPPVVVELKRAFNLGLVLQGIDRLGITDSVYLAIGTWPKRLRDVKKLCRRLGLGLMIVAAERVEVLLDPLPYQPRKNKHRAHRLLGEHNRRVGDPNRGGSTRQPIMTAYRQEALRCAALLAAHGPLSPRAMRAAADVPNAGRILRHDFYGWFERKDRGVYDLSPQGRLGIERFDIVPALPVREAATTLPATPSSTVPPLAASGRRSGRRPASAADAQ